MECWAHSIRHKVRFQYYFITCKDCLNSMLLIYCGYRYSFLKGCLLSADGSLISCSIPGLEPGRWRSRKGKVTLLYALVQSMQLNVLLRVHFFLTATAIICCLICRNLGFKRAGCSWVQQGDNMHFSIARCNVKTVPI